MSLLLINGCTNRDVYVEKPELSDVPGYKGVNVSEMWRQMARNNDDEIELFEPLKVGKRKDCFLHLR
ncbi:hypothetical protein JCM19233_6512 [Vibrio astriarenae]|nr:hypothetical protein JCM19233_6512 [Vibrio sp. C7]